MYIEFNKIMSNIKFGYYRYIGSGSSREVYDLGNGYVIKVAKNKAGIEQNKAEYYISSDDFSDLFAEVIEVSRNFNMLIMRKAKKIRDISYIWNYFGATNKKEFMGADELQNLKRRYNLLLGDFAKASSWGVIDGRPVIIDYGFTREVGRKYY